MKDLPHYSMTDKCYQKTLDVLVLLKIVLNETLYWFIHDSSFTVGATGKLDLIVSYNTVSRTITYHVISIKRWRWFKYYA